MKTVNNLSVKGMRATSLKYNKEENEALNTVPIFRNKTKKSISMVTFYNKLSTKEGRSKKWQGKKIPFIGGRVGGR